MQEGTMRVSRRGLIGGATFAAATAFALRASATEYEYDALGRLVRVTYDDGSTAVYAYDAAGNRRLVTRTIAGAPSFNQTIQITGSSPVSLRTLASTAGYDGARNAVITFQVGSGVTITGAAGASGGGSGGVGGVAIDTGTWPTDNYVFTLTLQVLNGGTVRGGGGGGGDGGGDPNSGGTPATVGALGGDAVYARLPMTVTVNSGGAIRAGGGGGGGGAEGTWGFGETNGGGGAGGGAPNGNGGVGGLAGIVDGGDGATGNNGTAGGGGAGGAGGSIGNGPGVVYGQTGGNGGNYGAAGTNAGGQPGYAIRKNGHTVTVTNNGTITGTVA
jgi:YD repeat-containing protein